MIAYCDESLEQGKCFTSALSGKVEKQYSEIVVL